MPSQLILNFSKDLPQKTLTNTKVLQRGKEAVVIELLQEGEISKEEAAELLEISQEELLHLIDEHDIPTEEDLALVAEFRELRKEIGEVSTGGNSVDDIRKERKG
ncbi:Uncharacterized protein MCHI_001891 [Candidatus Magnetoovum chiemensis]|nr:Uncharacterized protein MCHI_001891 [Candidatus Magnetoovum chiemensis]